MWKNTTILAILYLATFNSSAVARKLDHAKQKTQKKSAVVISNLVYNISIDMKAIKKIIWK